MIIMLLHYICPNYRPITPPAPNLNHFPSFLDPFICFRLCCGTYATNYIVVLACLKNRLASLFHCRRVERYTKILVQIGSSSDIECPDAGHRGDFVDVF